MSQRRRRVSRTNEAETQTMIPASRVEYAAAIVEVYKKLAKIEALATAPHWESERRWKIAGIAKEAMNLLEDPSK